MAVASKEELAATLKNRSDKRVVVFGSSIPENAIETMRMLRKAREEFHRHQPKVTEPPVRNEPCPPNGTFRKLLSQFFDQKFG